MKSFQTILKETYPNFKWFNISQINNAFNKYLRQQIGIYDNRPNKIKKGEIGKIRVRVNCIFNKWHGMIVLSTMKENKDGLVTIYLDKKVDHIHAKFLIKP